MKKPINYTIIFVMLVIINITGLLIACIVISSDTGEQNKLPEYVYKSSEKNEDYLLSNKTRLEIDIKDIDVFRSYDAIMYCEDIDKCYETFVVETINSNIEVGQILGANTVLGQYGGNDVLSKYRSSILSIDNNGSNYTISLYNSHNFKVHAYISQYDYYTYDFSEDKDTYYILSDKRRLSLSFIGLDYEHGVKEGNVKLIYSITSNDIILPGTLGALHIEDGTIEDAITVERTNFFYNYGQNDVITCIQRVEEEDGSFEYLSLYLTIEDMLGNDVIISGGEFRNGEYIYALK